jgi:glucose-6-phosphate 1-epimerase
MKASAIEMRIEESMTEPAKEIIDIDLDRLNKSFAIPAVAQIVAGGNGLPKVRVTTAAASAEIYLHGAHLTSWVPAGTEEVIFLSDKARFQNGIAIRGGVPICFPWFNAKSDAKAYTPSAPAHGFVRTKAWELESIIHEGNAVAVMLSTGNEEGARNWFPYDFRAEYRATIGAHLKLELTILNTSSLPFTFEEALHTYYRVEQIRDIRIVGLDGVNYQDNADSNREKLQRGENTFAGRTDNAYLNTRADLELIDPALNRRILIGKENSLNTVVWNPWEELARGMSDLGDDEWQRFVCVEAANIRAAAVTLQPGERHTMTVKIRLAERD